MAYTHSKYEVMMQSVGVGSASVGGAIGATQILSAGGVDLSATGIIATWSPGFVPHIIRGAAVVNTASDKTAANEANISIEADISTAGTPTRLFRLTLPSGGLLLNTAHFYRPTYQIEIKPGMVVQAKPSTGATAGVRGNIMLYVEPRWEEPGNVTGMIAVTAIPG